jgi:coenzyme F420 biosynthesis associated uncharacterized protein
MTATSSAGSSSPIDWRRAEQVATRVAARTPSLQVMVDPGWLEDRAAEAEDRVEAETGLRAAGGRPEIQLIDRAEWIRANIASFRQLLTPLLDRWAERSQGKSDGRSSRPLGGVALGATRQLAGAEVGLLLGWMSTRVLGQYDVLLDRGTGDDAVYLVGPNLAGLEERFGFDPDQFRMWVLLHELTHRAQFTGVPWMRPYFVGLVDESLRHANPDPAALLDALKATVKKPAEARERVRENGVIGLIAGDEQRATLARVGGLMSLLEGHGDVTMDRAAGDAVPDAERFGAVLRERRRNASPIAKFVQRLIGLEAKMNQYAAGERFIAAIEAHGGPRLVDRCWESAENLPTLEEIRDPQRWLARAGLLAS